MGAKEVFGVVGLGTPFYFAAATYGFFNWLDRNASSQATRAISGWLKREPYHRIDIRLAIIAVFDRLYTSPLTRPIAFLRSACFSLIVALSYMLFVILGLEYWQDPQSPSIVAVLINEAPFLLCIIISDYLSLFVVRRCLSSAGDYPFFALFAAVLLGCCFVAIAFTIALLIYIVVEPEMGISKYSVTSLLEFVASVFVSDKGRIFVTYMVPALLVHLWLPLFAVGALVY